MIEKLMVELRIRLLKVSDVNNLKVGKRIDGSDNNFQLFYAFDVENMDKLRLFKESAVYAQFTRQILDPYVIRSWQMNFEMEPGKDTRYS
ncbi:MAG: hypothetical protein RML49_06525 [Verrucomicrobiae bacterium]|nr:hypothetical protein [Verrucomicrobiae bacterium]